MDADIKFTYGVIFTITLVCILLLLIGIFVVIPASKVNSENVALEAKIADNNAAFAEFNAKKAALSTYQCVPGLMAPVKRNPATGFPEGMSLNANDIFWRKNVEDCNKAVETTPLANVKPALCNRHSSAAKSYWCGQALDGINSLLKPSADKVLATLPEKGPFSQAQLEAMWFEAGCTNPTSINDVSKVGLWNSQLTDVVKSDMKSHAAKTTGVSAEFCYGK